MDLVPLSHQLDQMGLSHLYCLIHLEVLIHLLDQEVLMVQLNLSVPVHPSHHEVLDFQQALLLPGDQRLL